MIVNQGNLQTLYRGFSAAFHAGFGSAPPDIEVAMEVRSEAREEEYGWLGQWPGLREWVGERALRGIVQHGYTIRNRKFESTVEVRRDDVRDDRYGVYGPMFTELGRAAAAHPAEIVYAALKKGFEATCYDGQYFFDTDHPVQGKSVSNDGGGAGTAWFLLDLSRAIRPIIFQRRRNYEIEMMNAANDEHVFMRDTYRYGVSARVNAGYGLWQLAYGSKQDLTAANYAAARAAILGVKGDQGRPLGCMPTHLVVPPALEGKALEILNAERDTNGKTNVWKGTAKAHVTPWLAAA